MIVWDEIYDWLGREIWFKTIYHQRASDGKFPRSTHPSLQEEDLAKEKKEKGEELQEEKHLERVEEKVEEVPAEEKEKREVSTNSFNKNKYKYKI